MPKSPIPGLPVTEDSCKHGAHRGAICERCAGPVNPALQLALAYQTFTEASRKLKNAIDNVLDQLQGQLPFELERTEISFETVSQMNRVIGWSTDVGVCMREMFGTDVCGCYHCVPRD